MKKWVLLLSLLNTLLITAQSGTLIVLNKSDDTADFINLDSGKSMATLPTGDGPHEVAVAPDGKTAVITNYGRASWPGNSLTVLDIPGKKIIKTITLDYKAPHGIEYIEKNTVLVTCEESKKLIQVNIKTGIVEKAIDTEQQTSHMVTYAPKYQRAFVANIRSGSVSVINVKQEQLEKILPTGNGAEGLALSANGKEIWVTNRASNTISVVDASSLEIKETLPCEKFPIRAKATPNGKYVLVSNAQSGDISVFEAVGKKLITKISMEATAKEKEASRLFQDFGESPVPVGILVLPDSKTAFVANTNADIITVIDLNTLQVVKRLTAGKEPDGLGYSPL
ncbi:YncE family protein [Ascidiimonas aurantiaca]|uniref:YncE family protein n=1 Tax=Ascidiimonas aurantiaca TaxID=1685432 RepID=UPI0030EC188C